MKNVPYFLQFLLIIGLYTPIKSSSQQTDSYVKKILAAVVIVGTPIAYIESMNWYRHYQQRKNHVLPFEQERLRALNFPHITNYSKEEYEKIQLLWWEKQERKMKLLTYLAQLSPSKQQINSFDSDVVQATQAIAQIDRQLVNIQDMHTLKRFSTTIPIEPNGELAKVCAKIRCDMSMSSDDINVVWGNQSDWLVEQSGAFYDPVMKTIVLNPNLTAQQIIPFLAHEYRHYQQFCGNTQKKFTTKKDLEHDAETAMASYITCHKCLQCLASNRNRAEDHAKGYFSKECFKPYIEQAQTKGTLCHAHSFPGIFQNQSSLMDYFPK